MDSLGYKLIWTHFKSIVVIFPICEVHFLEMLGPNFENCWKMIKTKQIKISVSIKKNQITAYKAKKITSAIDLNKISFYKSNKYWEEIIPVDNSFIIEKDEFYILRSKELIKIKDDQAGELEPFKDSFGNFRVHYAGFFDPGFGNNKSGTPAVLELRAYDTPFIIRDGQLVGQLNYYEIDKIKKNSYGFNIRSNYFNQNLKLAKQFK